MTGTLWDGIEPVNNSTAAHLREAWLEHRQVRLALSYSCDVPLVVGKITHVSVTSTMVTVDGWMIPIEEILDVDKPSIEEIDRYADLMHHLRKGDVVCGFCHGEKPREPAAWIDGCWRPPGTCPRCGRTL